MLFIYVSNSSEKRCDWILISSFQLDGSSADMLYEIGTG